MFILLVFVGFSGFCVCRWGCFGLRLCCASFAACRVCVMMFGLVGVVMGVWDLVAGFRLCCLVVVRLVGFGIASFVVCCCWSDWFG